MPVEQHSDPFEDRLSAALHQAGDTFDTDRAALAAAGTARGRRLGLRRRAALVGGTAGVALAGVGGALLVSWNGSSSGPQSASVAATPRPTRTSSPVTGEEMIRTLEGLLPKGRFSEATGRGAREEPRGYPYAQLVHDDGKGAAAVSLSLNRVAPGSDEAREAVQCPDKVYIPHDSCVTTRLPDASVLTIMKRYEYPDRRVDTKLWTADLVTPTGQHVSVSEWNAAAEKDAPISRAEPPLSSAELKELVTAGKWRGFFDAIPQDPMQTQDPPASQDRSGAAVTPTLTGLLPADVKIASHSSDGDDEFAYVVVDDGKGQSLVQINVQPGMGAQHIVKQLYGTGSETLSDGTRVAERQGPGEKGGAGVVMWTVDTLRPDGLRVVISAFNSGTQHTAATRTAPALTMKQLRTIALSPKWEQ
jgi:hypothetical protein